MSTISKIAFPMPLAQALAGRFSVRDFKPDPVSRTQVSELLHAAVRAPTAMHQEAWSFVVVQDRQRLRQISERAKPLFLEQLRHASGDHPPESLERFADASFNVFYNAGTLIVVCAVKDAPFAQADAWLATENILLAAHAAGLGSCVIGSAVAALELPEVRGALNIPAAYAVVAPVIVGIAAHAGVPTPRMEPHILHWG